MGVSNNITAVLNFTAVLCSIPIIASGIWLASKPDNECIRWLRWPVVFVGILILLVSLAGFMGAYWNKQGLLGLYLCCMAILITCLVIFLILAFTVTRPNGAYHVPGLAFREYRLGGFSSWLQNHVTDGGDWIKIRACLAESNFCSKLNQKYVSAEQFFAAHISPLQSGCCKPPSICGFHYVNPTLWTDPVNPTVDGDCSVWNNDPAQLCFGCDSCKAGLLGNLRDEWGTANVILIVAVVVLISVYLIACSAYRNALAGHK